MALINRVARLFKADLHAVLDQMEEPEPLLKQAIRDMESELASLEQLTAHRVLERKSLCEHRAEIQSSVQDIEEQLDLCFVSGKDELARGLIRRKLESGRILKRLDSKIESITSAIQDQQKLIDENRGTLESLRQKAELFECHGPTRNVSRSIADTSWIARDLNVSEDDVEIAFLREKTQRCES
jgi:phage shock protein A